LFEAEIGSGPWVLGECFSALDVYVGVMSHWRPRREWFAAHCPKLDAVAANVVALPALAPVWKRNFKT
jgi:GST-like protein